MAAIFLLCLFAHAFPEITAQPLAYAPAQALLFLLFACNLVTSTASIMIRRTRYSERPSRLAALYFANPKLSPFPSLYYCRKVSSQPTTTLRASPKCPWSSFREARTSLRMHKIFLHHTQCRALWFSYCRAAWGSLIGIVRMSGLLWSTARAGSFSSYIWIPSSGPAENWYKHQYLLGYFLPSLTAPWLGKMTNHWQLLFYEKHLICNPCQDAHLTLLSLQGHPRRSRSHTSCRVLGFWSRRHLVFPQQYWSRSAWHGGWLHIHCSLW